MAKVLVIDDDQDLLTLIKLSLESEHQVEMKTATKDLTAVDFQKVDLVILDVMMPEEDGFSFLRRFRNKIDAPVLFLTAKDFEADLLEGFASGGDDYLTKPFSVKELRARVGAHLRRETREKSQRLIDGEISCDLISRQFFIDNESISITSSEYDLCVFLLKNRKQVFSKEDIYVAVYGYDGTGDSQTTITERVKQIRQKFAKYKVNPIQTVWGIGYKWEIHR